MTQKLIEFRADLHYSRGRLLLHDEIRDFVAIRFPVGFRYAQLSGKVGSWCAFLSGLM